MLYTKRKGSYIHFWFIFTRICNIIFCDGWSWLAVFCTDTILLDSVLILTGCYFSTTGLSLTLHRLVVCHCVRLSQLCGFLPAPQVPGDVLAAYWRCTGGLLWRNPNNETVSCMKSNSKHDTLVQCWVNFGPASQTVAQHSTNIGSLFPICMESNPNIQGEIAHRFWSDVQHILTAFQQHSQCLCLLYVWFLQRTRYSRLEQCWASVVDYISTLSQHWVNALWLLVETMPCVVLQLRV